MNGVASVVVLNETEMENSKYLNLNYKKIAKQFVKKLIDRRLIIAKRHAVIRAGLKPSFTFSTFRIRERMNVKPVTRAVTTTYRSPNVSQVYNSVFCEKLTNPEWLK